jgi:hypothetical protein
MLYYQERDGQCVQNLFRKSDGLGIDGKVTLIWVTNGVSL